jgi:hypothetical protein
VKTETAVHDPGTPVLTGNTKRASNRQQKQPYDISFGLHNKPIPALLTGSFEQASWFFKGSRSK